MKTEFITLLHSIGTTKKLRLDFTSDKLPTDYYELLTLEGYGMYQFIEHEYLHNLKPFQMLQHGVKYESISYKKKTWFGLGEKTIHDILIFPKKGFFYPYHYGNYFYLYTRHAINIDDFQKWMSFQFPDRFQNFGDTYLGSNSQQLQLLNEDDYLLVNSRYTQDHFGITGADEIIQRLRKKLESMDLSDLEIESYNPQNKGDLT